jgi:carbon-monoxide dehydrogenase medium subunit
MRPAPFRYQRATDLDGALAAVAAGAVPLAGGQSLMPRLKLRLARPDALVDLNRAVELQGIEVLADGAVSIGSMTRHQMLADSLDLRGALSALPEAAGRIADPQVRARGTIGGSICAADPRANLPAALIALDAVAVAASAEGERRIPLHELPLDVGRTGLAEGELLARVEIPPQTERVSAYDELSVQPNGVPIVNVAVSAGSDLRIGIGGLLRTHWRADDVATVIAAADASPEVVVEALRSAASDRSRFEDLHGDAEYRLRACAVLVARAVERARSVV